MKSPEDIRKIVAARLGAGRKNAGLSQAQVAKFMGLHRPSISEIEAGRRKVSAEELARFAELYKVDSNWLTGADTPDANRVRDELLLAARKLESLKPEDLQAVVDFVSSLSAKPRGES